jgi:hypothetical protein
VDAFGTDEVTFITLLKGNWFLGISLSHKPLPIGLMSGIWLPGGCYPLVAVDGFEALHSALQARKQMCYYLSLVHESLQRFDLAFWCFGMVLRNLTAYQMIRLRWDASQVPVNAQNRYSPYPIWGIKYIIGPHISSSIQTNDPPWVYTWGGGGGWVALLFLPKLHCQPNFGFPSSHYPPPPPPFFFSSSSFWVEVKNSSKPVAPNDLSTPYDILPWSQEMPKLAVVNKTLMM